MQRFFKILEFFLLLNVVLGQDAIAKPRTDIPLPAKDNSEKYKVHQCQWTGFKSSGCDTLLQDLCAKIEQKNSLCLLNQVKMCHGDDDKAKINSSACWASEKAFCTWTDFEQEPGFCDAHQDEFCKTIQYRTRRCMLLRQRMTVNRNEEQLEKNMSIKVLGHNTSDIVWKNLGEAIKQIDKAIDDLEDQLKNPLSILQQGQIKKQIKDLEKERAKLVPAYQDARDLREQCEQIFPLKFHKVEVRYNPNCDTKKDSLCPHKRPGQ